MGGVMKTSALFALMIALGMGTASVLHIDHRNQFAGPHGTAAQIDGAVRDGLYLGRLAAERGVAVGRWANLQDRSSFTAGYQQGYREFLASRVAPTTTARPTD